MRTLTDSFLSYDGQQPSTSKGFTSAKPSAHHHTKPVSVKNCLTKVTKKLKTSPTLGGSFKKKTKSYKCTLSKCPFKSNCEYTLFIHMISSHKNFRPRLQFRVYFDRKFCEFCSNKTFGSTVEKLNHFKEHHILYLRKYCYKCAMPILSIDTTKGLQQHAQHTHKSIKKYHDQQIKFRKIVECLEDGDVCNSGSYIFETCNKKTVI